MVRTSTTSWAPKEPTGVPVPPLAEAVELYLAMRTSQVQPKTLQLDQWALRKLTEAGAELPIDEVVVYGILASMPKISTRRRLAEKFKQFFNWVEGKYQIQNVLRNYRLPKERRAAKRIFTVEEMRQLGEMNLPPLYRTMVYAMLDAGTRIQELGSVTNRTTEGRKRGPFAFLLVEFLKRGNAGFQPLFSPKGPPGRFDPGKRLSAARMRPCVDVAARQGELKQGD